MTAPSPSVATGVVAGLAVLVIGWGTWNDAAPALESIPSCAEWTRVSHTSDPSRWGIVCTVDGSSSDRRLPPGVWRLLRRPIPLNCLDDGDLESLPGVGRRLANRMRGSRPWTSINALTRVPGLGVATVESWGPIDWVSCVDDR